MTNLFLKAKHWQIFLLTYGIPLIFQMVFISIMFSLFDPEKLSIPLVFPYIFAILFIIIVISGTITLGWFYSVSVGLQHKISDNVKMNTGFFKFCLFFPAAYISIFIFVFMISFFDAFTNQVIPDFGIFALIIPCHFFSMFCILYCLYFTAKAIKTAEMQRRVRFSDFAGELFMLWFFFIGVWIIQPRLNKIVNDENDYSLEY